MATSSNLDNLAKIGKLKVEPPSQVEIDGLFVRYDAIEAVPMTEMAFSLFTSIPPRISRLGADGGTEIGPEYQRHCVQSWVRAGFKVVSVNPPAEAAEVEAMGLPVEVMSTDANGKQGVWVVPNPYRGYARLRDRPSSWDLTPNASDPTGTHIDFLGLPPGPWTIRVYTVSGDLVQTIKLAEQIMGRGSERVRPPRLPLTAERRAAVTALVNKAAAARPAA